MMEAASSASVFMHVFLSFLIHLVTFHANSTDRRGQYWSPSPKAHGGRACCGIFVQNGLPHQWYGLLHLLANFSVVDYWAK